MNKVISIERVLELSDRPRIKFKPVKHFLIDRYLDGFKSRRRKTEKLSVVCFNHFTLYLYSLSIIKFLVIQAFHLDSKHKLILFDLSYLLGGLELYNRMLLVFTCLLGIIANY